MSLLTVFLQMIFFSEVLETINFQKLTLDAIQYLDRKQVSCVSRHCHCCWI